MSLIGGKVGKWELGFKSAPRGAAGEVEVTVDGKRICVRWKADDHGLWLESPDGVIGFDFEGERDENGAIRYRLLQRAGAEEYAGLALKRAGEAEASASQGQKKALRVRSQMPGKIVRIQVKEGDTVQKGDPLLVMEAMKMENEIRAQHAGVIQTIKVTAGQAIETGADLILMNTL